MLSSLASAKTEMNAMCYLEDKSGASVEGTNTQNKYEIASVSKIVTSFWAIDTLGPDFRFNTKVFVDPVGNGTYDVHIAGSSDPYFGREMTYFLFSELYRNQITKIRTLSFDEKFTLFWNVREKPTWSFNPSPSDIQTTLRQKLRLNNAEYTITRLNAKKMGVDMVDSPRISVSQIGFLTSYQYQQFATTQIYQLQSAPLHDYLKEMNRNSNNHVADHIFAFLGGPDSFQRFIKSRLNLEANEIQFVNGSGDKVVVKDDKNKSQKVYNESSCNALVEVIEALRRDLRKDGKYDLQNIMAVSGVDPKTTLGGRYATAQVSGAVVAKTGSVDPAITLAGMITTANGNVYFGILYKTKSPSDWNSARNAIREKVIGLMNQFGGKDAINDYNTEGFLPFDNGSHFATEEVHKP